MRRFSFLLPLALAATLTGCGGLGEIPQSGGAGEMDLPNNSVQIQITGDPVQEEPAETAPMVLPVDPALSEIPETGTATWTLEDGVLTISGSGVLPEASWEKEYHDETAQSITKVLIGNGIIDLPYSAFGDHDSLVSASIGDGFTYVPSLYMAGAKRSCTSILCKKYRLSDRTVQRRKEAFEKFVLEFLKK